MNEDTMDTNEAVPNTIEELIPERNIEAEYPIAGFATDIYEDAEIYFDSYALGTREGRVLHVGPKQYGATCFVLDEVDGVQRSLRLDDPVPVRFKLPAGEPKQKLSWWGKIKHYLNPPQAR